MSRAEEILKSVPNFLRSILEELNSIGMDVGSCPLDHFCYRVATWDDYRELKEAFAKQGVLLSEAQIGGRPIATYRLHSPVEVDGRMVNCIELPAPKESKPYPNGLEHCEFVIQESFDSWAGRFPKLPWDWRGSKKALNAELSLELKNGKSVKFHHLSLEEVIRIEESESAICAKEH